MITWNVNKSSAQYHFLSDVAQCQANEAMFQETQNWQPDGADGKLGWVLLKEKKDGKAAIAVKRRNMNLLRHSKKHMMGSCGLGEHGVPILVLAATLGVAKEFWKNTSRP